MSFNDNVIKAQSVVNPVNSTNTTRSGMQTKPSSPSNFGTGTTVTFSKDGGRPITENANLTNNDNK